MNFAGSKLVLRSDTERIPFYFEEIAGQKQESFAKNMEEKKGMYRTSLSKENELLVFYQVTKSCSL